MGHNKTEDTKASGKLKSKVSLACTCPFDCNYQPSEEDQKSSMLTMVAILHTHLQNLHSLLLLRRVIVGFYVLLCFFSSPLQNFVPTFVDTCGLTLTFYILIHLKTRRPNMLQYNVRYVIMDCELLRIGEPKNTSLPQIEVTAHHTGARVLTIL